MVSPRREEDRSQRDDALQLARRIDDIADVDGLFVRTGAADTLERVLVHIIDGSVLVCHSHVRLKSEYDFHFSGKQIEVASFQSGGGRRKQGAAEYLPVQTDILFITLRSRKNRIQYR